MECLSINDLIITMFKYFNGAYITETNEKHIHFAFCPQVFQQGISKRVQVHIYYTTGSHEMVMYKLPYNIGHEISSHQQGQWEQNLLVVGPLILLKI